jgi:hypothetical protein
MDIARVAERVNRVWDDEVVPALVDFIRIPNVSPSFDADWAAHGHMARAVALVHDWIEARPVAGRTVEVATLAGARRSSSPRSRGRPPTPFSCTDTSTNSRR